MTTYYKQVNESGELVLLLTYDFIPKITNSLIVQITQDEYETLTEELHAKNDAETEHGEAEKLTEVEEKAQAYDILMGVSE